MTAQLLLFAVLIAGIVAVTPLAHRLRMPQPVLLVVFGIVIALVPLTPTLRLDPQLVLPIVLPPLLFAATQRTSVHEFRSNARPILLLAIGLTVATAAVVAVVAHTLGLSWATAWVLGAVVAPPDPVAATAVARGLRLPHRLVTLLEGEGMFNDATALVLYKVSVAAVVTGTFSIDDAAIDLVLAILLGLAIGLAIAWLTRQALSVLHDDATETTITLAAPFATYLLAEELGGSGVLAVIMLGLFLGTYGHDAVTSGGYLLGRAVTRYADFIITSLVFTMIGIELTDVLGRAELDHSSARLAVGVVASVVLFRAAWMYPAAWLILLRNRRRNLDAPYNWRETTVVTWAGMRGVVTVATALALPLHTTSGDPFPERDHIVLAALVCVLVTLVAQGLTLAPLVRRLGVVEESAGGEQVAELRRRAAESAISTLEQHLMNTSEPIREAVRAQYEGFITAQAALEDARHATSELEDTEATLAQLLEAATAAERDTVLEALRTGEASAEVAEEVLRDIEFRAIRDAD